MNLITVVIMARRTEIPENYYSDNKYCDDTVSLIISDGIAREVKYQECVQISQHSLDRVMMNMTAIC